MSDITADIEHMQEIVDEMRPLVGLTLWHISVTENPQETGAAGVTADAEWQVATIGVPADWRERVVVSDMARLMAHEVTHIILAEAMAAAFPSDAQGKRLEELIVGRVAPLVYALWKENRE